MKKTSLFLSVAWLAMAAMSFETHAATGAATQAPTTPGWGATFKGFFKKNPAPSTVTSSSAVESPAVGAGEGVPPLAQATAAPKAAEAEDADNVQKSMTALGSSDSTTIKGFKDLLSKVGKNRLGSAFSSSKKCRTWGGYRAELTAGRDFYGSNCAIEFCSQYCAPVSAAKFWADKTLGETVCAFRCARGVSMGDSNARLKAAYDATKGRAVWSDAVTHWQELEGASVVTAENLVNADAADAVRSAKAIAAYKGAVKAAAKSTSPAEVRAENELGAAGVAMTEAYVKFKLAADDIQKKAQALNATITKTEAAIEAAEAQGFDYNRISKTISVALKSGKVSLQQYGRLFKGQLGFVQALDDVRAGKTIEHSKLLETVKEYEGAYAQLNAIFGTKSNTEGADVVSSAVTSPASSAETTDIEKGLQAIIDGGTSNNDRGEARKAFIDQHQDKVALKKALKEIQKKSSPLSAEAGTILGRRELKSVVAE